MRLRRFFLATWTCTLVLAAGLRAGAQSGSPSDGAVLGALNFARTRPQEYAQRLRLQPGLAREDRAALAEAIDFLSRQAPLPPLAPDAALAAVARAYVAEQGPTGQTGHLGPGGEGLRARLNRQGARFAAGGETIAYGSASAEEAVRQLIIDSGVPDRGHRRVIFDPGFSWAGASCGPHRAYRTMCVIDFGGARRGS